MRKPPTINDVAVAAGVSRQTVSNVINSPDIVRPETRGRVQTVIADLGYRPHASARRLRTRRASTIAVRIDRSPEWLSGNLLDRFLFELTHRAAKHGLRVMLYTADDPLDEIRVISHLFDGSDVDAFVLTSTFLGDPRPAWLIAHGAPFVTFGRPWGIPADDLLMWVDVDGRFGTQAATEYLLNSGATRIGFLGWPEGSGTGDDRREGWRQAMLAREGAAPMDGLSLLDVSANEDLRDGHQAARVLRDRGADAIVATSDTLALAAMMATDGRIPVVGFDNGPVAASMRFSSIDQHLDLVTDYVLRLLDRGSTGEGPAHYIVKPELVIRDGGSES